MTKIIKRLISSILAATMVITSCLVGNVSTVAAAEETFGGETFPYTHAAGASNKRFNFDNKYVGNVSVEIEFNIDKVGSKGYFMGLGLDVVTDYQVALRISDDTACVYFENQAGVNETAPAGELVVGDNTVKFTLNTETNEATCTLNGTTTGPINFLDYETSVNDYKAGVGMLKLAGKSAADDRTTIINSIKVTGNVLGEETAAEVLEISNADELYDFASRVNGGETTLSAVLVNDIVINEGTMNETASGARVWTPIGNDSIIYTGSFDGQGHTISGLYFNDTSADYAGLFGYMGSGAEVKNTNVVNSYISGNCYVGGICGYSSGTISGCGNAGTVSGSLRVGGICGYNYISSSTISGCGNAGTVSGSSYVGGVCGYNSSGTISSCSSTGSGSVDAGGICGYNSGTISSCCYLSGTASGGIGSGSGKAAEKTEEEYASGEVCYLLNGSVSGGDIWYQTLGTDNYPVLDSTHGKVYITGTQYCPNKIEVTQYNNTSENLNIENENHSYNANGVCSYCGGPESAVYNATTNSYEISNYAQLLYFADIVNSGSASVNGILMNDITANEGTITAESTSAKVWTPIGNSSIMYIGSFNGQGHTISGLYFSDTSTDYAGLFGYMGSGAEVKNTYVVNSYISGNRYVGGICGRNYSGTISGCGNSGTVSGSSRVGGICGGNSGGTISSCINAGTVSGSSDVGGICGYSNGTISGCSSTGTVSGSSNVGGVCGCNSNGTISSCCYLSGTASRGIGSGSGEAAEKTEEEYASGEVCYLLNNKQTENVVFYQSIGTDSVPNFDKAKGVVYYVNGNYCNKGDMNGSRTLDKADAAIILKCCSDIITDAELEKIADYNSDGKVDMRDVIAVLNAAA